jgi:hypothetical protein
VEQVPVHTLFRVSVSLVVPLKTLYANEEAHDVESAIRAPSRRLRSSSKITNPTCAGSSGGSRSSGGGRLRQLKTGGATPAPPRGWRVALRPGEPHLANLREVVVTVLRYAEARGDVPPGELELEEVIDTFDESKDRGPEDIRSRLVWFALTRSSAP